MRRSFLNWLQLKSLKLLTLRVFPTLIAHWALSRLVRRTCCWTPLINR